LIEAVVNITRRINQTNGDDPNSPVTVEERKSAVKLATKKA
jgi:hypothetical protein